MSRTDVMPDEDEYAFVGHSQPTETPARTEDQISPEKPNKYPEH